MFAVILLASCTKEGPQGPKGDTGDQGPQGPAGTSGINELIYQIQPSEWTGPWDNGSGGTVYDADINVSFITQDIVDYGAVLVYWKRYYDSGYSYYALPVPVVLNDNSTRLTSFEYWANNVRIHIQNTDNNTHGYGAQTYKIVAIDGARLSTNPGVDLSDYALVSKVFHLNE